MTIQDITTERERGPWPWAKPGVWAVDPRWLVTGVPRPRRLVRPMDGSTRIWFDRHGWEYPIDLRGRRAATPEEAAWLDLLNDQESARPEREAPQEVT